VERELAQLREEYRMGSLDETDVGGDPVPVVERWLADAIDAGLDEPNAMTLATVGADGRPSARTVLLKGFDADGFRFFTNYGSRKAAELAGDPRCALVLTWPALARQVRVGGVAHRLPAEESAAYFASRPRGARLGAWVSDQSRPIAGRHVLEERRAELEAAYDGVDDIPCPPDWGGYRVVPDEIELWHGRPDRLHDRFRFTRPTPGAPWQRERLAP
jgi:pyridoxamine 5'-phosphate oxidase